MSVLDITAENYSLTLGDVYTTSMVYGKKILLGGEAIRCAIEKLVLNDINTCPIDKWPFDFLNSVKSHLNEYLTWFNINLDDVSISVEPHPLCDGAVIINFLSRNFIFLFCIYAIKKSEISIPDPISSNECLCLKL